ncbi:heptaprenylglyceryl phosphate synthase [Paenibacillus caseinilyticus]|uniref:Heptaprenylglyceryl phosphate synthase n=1 Tax=Paenibacillus mucilaginosus K02 TaxID=997761 RepID=I0BA89_9BACL|nr:heptaprenylglyceryl phosphate synthase [Paenibacillus mucilaginosus]AFH59286.1 heptaprenylglyceryl phosphate synthase [Paenibacillus mucilaginosus K02]
MHLDLKTWKHVFKLDPDRELGDEELERVCLSGTDAILVGGSTGVTFDNTVDLLARVRRYEVPCVLEVSEQEAIVPGFDLYFIPVVLNSRDPQWITGRQHAALKDYGAIMDWSQIVTEGYIMLNGESSAARITSSETELSGRDVEAYARLAERLFRCPVVYMEYSGIFGDMALVKKVSGLLGESRLFYGGGIDGPDKARQAAEAAHTVVVGNSIYYDLESALQTVQAVREAGGAAGR